MMPVNLTKKLSKINKKDSPEGKTTKHKINVTQVFFEPCYLRIKKGDIVEWRLDFSDGSKRRMHIISFDSICEESNPLRSEDDFYKYRFFECGTFTYKCQIFRKMKGIIEVYDPEPTKSTRPVTNNDLLTLFNSRTKEPMYKPVERLFSQHRKNSASERRSWLSSERANSMMIRSEKSNSELSQRLIQVLEDEEDLRKSVTGNAEHPFIAKTFFQEIFENK